MGAWRGDNLRTPVESAINRKLNITRDRTKMPRLHDGAAKRRLPA